MPSGPQVGSPWEVGGPVDPLPLARSPILRRRDPGSGRGGSPGGQGLVFGLTRKTYTVRGTPLTSPVISRHVLCSTSCSQNVAQTMGSLGSCDNLTRLRQLARSPLSELHRLSLGVRISGTTLPLPRLCLGAPTWPPSFHLFSPSNCVWREQSGPQLWLLQGGGLNLPRKAMLHVASSHR